MKIKISFMYILVLGFASLEADAQKFGKQKADSYTAGIQKSGAGQLGAHKSRRSAAIEKFGGGHMNRAQRRAAQHDLSTVKAADVRIAIKAARAAHDTPGEIEALHQWEDVLQARISAIRHARPLSQLSPREMHGVRGLSEEMAKTAVELAKLGDRAGADIYAGQAMHNGVGISKIRDILKKMPGWK